MMTSSEAATRRGMTGMPEQAAAPGATAGAPALLPPPAPAVGKETLEHSKTAPDRLEVMQGTRGRWERCRRQPRRGQAAADLCSELLPVLPHRALPDTAGAPALPGWSFCETRGNRNYRSPAQTITGRELILLLNEFRCYSSNFCII